MVIFLYYPSGILSPKSDVGSSQRGEGICNILQVLNKNNPFLKEHHSSSLGYAGKYDLGGGS